MATPKSQRIGIWIIAIVLTVGTLGSFLAIILGNQNNAADQAKITQQQKEYTVKYNEYSTKVDEQTKSLSKKYYGILSKYAKIPAAFDARNVNKIVKTDLLVGGGAEITTKIEYSAYYIGWNPKGVIFDQSIDKGALKAPISGSGLITGWSEGALGMKLGGVREISIPSDKAYGKTGSGENIPPNTPIKFIILAIPKVNEITVPAMPVELEQYYQTQYQSQTSSS